MENINVFREQQYDPERFMVPELFRFCSNMQHKPGETALELAATICQETATCDFTSIREPQDQTLCAKFICSIGNETVLKAPFKIKDDELMFTSTVDVTMETEDPAKASKETVHRPWASESNTPIYKVNPRRLSAKHKATSSKPFAKAVCPKCGKTGNHTKERRFINANSRFCKRKGHMEVVC